ncbi:hypothetical protein Hdeb2414_s0005g00170901 [Helianthus debilis subsp. tardiflorus]
MNNLELYWCHCKAGGCGGRLQPVQLRRCRPPISTPTASILNVDILTLVTGLPLSHTPII